MVITQTPRRCLLDTDAVIDYLGGVDQSVRLVREMHDRGDVLCTCAMVVAEVYAGLHPKDRTQGARLLDALLFLSTPPEAAKQAGVWRCEYARGGVTLSASDVLVAATAQHHGAGILTGNATHYPMSEVSVLSLPR